MTNRHTDDIHTANPDSTVKRDPAADRRRDWSRYYNALRGRRGAFADLDKPRSPALDSDGTHQIERKLSRKRERRVGHIETRWWVRYFRLFEQWMLDRTDADEVGK